MTAIRVPIHLKVLMDRMNITPWVTSVGINQSGLLYTEFTIETKGWHNFQPGASWDIYASFDESTPEAELLIRNGVVPPDRQPELTIDKDGPGLSIKGYDGVWLAQRRSPKQTIVFARNNQEARKAVAKYDDPIGAFRVESFPSGMTLKAVIERLANLAGFNLQFGLRDWDLQAFVMSPTNSYWAEIRRLYEPLGTYVYFNGPLNTLVITDSVSSRTDAGTLITLGEDAYKSSVVMPSIHKTIKRVIVRVPR